MNETERARSLADRYWEELLELEPMLGTMIGDERYDDRLSDPSGEGRERSRAVNQAALDELASIYRTALDITMRGTLDVMEAIARRAIAELAHGTDRLRAAAHFFGPAQTLAEVASMQAADTPTRRSLRSRLRGFPAYMDAWGQIAREGVETGVTSPRLVTERAVAQLDRLLALEPEASPAIAPVAADPDAAQRIADVVRDVVNPAFARYRETLQTYLPHCTETIGLSALTDGEGLYAALILAWTTLPLDPHEVHDLGLERYARIQDERAAIAGRLGYADAADAIAAHQASGANTAGSRDELLALAREQVERSWEASRAFFGRMPHDNCDVRPVEEFREQDTPLGFYNPPTEDGSRRGAYYINTSDLPGRPLHHIASLTYHEANPGHHFQLSIEQEIPTGPRWAVRRHPREQRVRGRVGPLQRASGRRDGRHLNDWERLGMLEAQGMRAARLVTDTGIHALGWSRQQAIDSMEAIGTPHIDAVIEIDRYIAIPGQALSYMIGMIEVERARQAATEREGAAFSLPDFHDRLLALGQLPLPALRRELG